MASSQLEKNKYGTGFTLVEVMIVVSIAVLLSAAVTVQFQTAERSRNVRIAADDVQSAIRLTQNKTLSGTPFQLGPPPVPAKDFGWRINMLAPTQYAIFTEDHSDVLAILETNALPPKVVFNNLMADSNPAEYLEVRFFPPFASITMKYKKLSDGSVVEAANIIAAFEVLYQGTTQKRTITVDGISGRVSVQ